jgi:hypothetical protein
MPHKVEDDLEEVIDGPGTVDAVVAGSGNPKKV